MTIDNEAARIICVFLQIIMIVTHRSIHHSWKPEIQDILILAYGVQFFSFIDLMRNIHKYICNRSVFEDARRAGSSLRLCDCLQ